MTTQREDWSWHSTFWRWSPAAGVWLGPDKPLTSLDPWIKLVSGRYTLQVRHGFRHDDPLVRQSFHLDIDLDLSRLSHDPPFRRREWAFTLDTIFEVCATTFADFGLDIEDVHWTWSGNRSLWMHIWFTRPTPTAALRPLRHLLSERIAKKLEGRMVTACVDADNLGAEDPDASGPSGVRLPLSVHQSWGINGAYNHCL